LVTVRRVVVEQAVKSLLMGKDYREGVVHVIEDLFFNGCIEFFKRIVNKNSIEKQKRLDSLSVSEPHKFSKYLWYLDLMLNPDLDKDEIANNAGLNMKTINNWYNTTRKEVVVSASNEHYFNVLDIIKEIIEENDEFNLELSVDFKSFNVKLDLIETLNVINALATKKAGIRGGAYSSIGQKIEKPLMITLSRILKVPKENYIRPADMEESVRDIDFYYFKDDIIINCEIKMMGKGNPESFDSALARNTNIYISNKISDLGKKELTKMDISWLELQNNDSIINDFGKILQKFDIPFTPYEGDYRDILDEVLNKVLDDLSN